MSHTVAFLSRASALRQVDLWRSCLPWIQPHYAVKSNTMAPLLMWFRESGIGFDCASPNEVRSVLHVGGLSESIIYANPCKSVDDIQYCMNADIPYTVVDCVEEVEKLVECGWKQGILVRLAVPDAQSRQPFSSKFGASLESLPAIYCALLEGNMSCVGFSFHVGSECMDPSQYYTAIGMCAEAVRISKRFGIQSHIIDIGGGFLPHGESFRAAAKEIAAARATFFAFQDYKWIAEPGRFFAQPTVSLRIPVIGVRRSVEKGCAYTLNESIYGMFSCVPFDNQKPVFTTDKPMDDSESCVLFGRTCDSADVLGRAMLPVLRVGDVLDVENMGAYTYVSSSEFNGFSKPTIELV